MSFANVWKRRILKRVTRRPTFVRTYRFDGWPMMVEDATNSMATEFIYEELSRGDYEVKGMDLKAGDVVVDLGAHVGMFAMMVAHRFPGVRVIAYEPVPETFACLQRNLARNGMTAVTAVNLAVTGDGRDVEMWMSKRKENTGGSQIGVPTARDLHDKVSVHSVTLDELFRKHAIARCALLKIDVEGAEYEILQNAHILDRVEALVGEFHYGPAQAAQGYSYEALEALVRRYVPSDRTHITHMG